MRLLGSENAALVLASLNTLVFVLSQPFIGYGVDRLPQRKMAIAADIALAIVNILIPVLYFSGHLSPTITFFLLVLAYPIQTMWSSLSRVLIRRAVEKEELLKANSISAVAIQGGALLGAVLGGMIIEYSNEAVVLLFNSTTFVFSAICLLFLRELKYPQTIDARTPRNLWRDIGAALFFLKEHPLARKLALSMTVFLMVFPVSNAFLGPLIRKFINGTAEDFGIIDAAYGFGGILSGLLIPYLVKLFGNRRIIIIGGICLGIALIGLGQSDSIPKAFLFFSLTGFFFHFLVVVNTELQHASSINYQGRITSVIDLMMNLSSFCIISLTAALPQFEVPQGYLCLGVFVAIAIPLLIYPADLNQAS